MSHDPRLDHLHYLVEATSFEQQCLWRKYAQESHERPCNIEGRSWVEDCRGIMTCVGKFEGCEIWVSVLLDGPETLEDLNRNKQALDAGFQVGRATFYRSK